MTLAGDCLELDALETPPSGGMVIADTCWIHCLRRNCPSCSPSDAPAHARVYYPAS